MDFNFVGDMPIYQQIMDFLVVDFALGKYKQDDRLPSVREYALMFKVNPNTIQRALVDLEESGLIYTKRGDGKFFTGDMQKATQMRYVSASKKTNKYLEDMVKMGYDKDQVVKFILKEE